MVAGEGYLRAEYTAESNDIKVMMYCDLTLDVGQIQSIMHQVFLDCCRNDRAKREIAGLGVAMTAEASTSHDCGKQGPYARSYVKSKRKNRTKYCGPHEKQNDISNI